MGKRMAVVQLSDPSGQYEAVAFEEVLNRYRDLLEPGTSVILQVGADMRPEGVNIRINSVNSLEEQASRVAKDLRIFLRDPNPIDNVAPILEPASRGSGEGRVSFIVIQDQGASEVEIELKDRFRLSPEIAGAIKGVPGVVEVEMV